MTQERTRTRIRCLVDELPADVRAEVDEMLADTSIGYVEISATLAAKGFSISKSSIGRYAQRSGKMALRLREIREQAQEYIRLLEDDQELDIAKVTSTVYLQQLMRRVVEAGDDEFTSISLDKAGDLLTKMIRASVYEGRYSKKRRSDLEIAQEAVLQQVRAELQGDPDLMARLQEKVQKSLDAAKVVPADEE